MIHLKKQQTINFWLRWLLASKLILAACILIPILPAYAASEQPELYEQVYLSETQALKTVFGSLKVTTKKLTLTENKKRELQRLLHRKIPETAFTLFEGREGKQLKRYALILDEKGKHFPITFIVALNPDASVHQVAIMVYRERRGDGVKRKRFLLQFNHKNRNTPIEVNKDIVHLTGSTISSWSIAAGVRKAVVLIDELVLKP